MDIKERLEYLRGELRAERISWEELAELQDLHIDPSDVELLEAAGVEEKCRCEVCGKWTDEGGCDNPELCGSVIRQAKLLKHRCENRSHAQETQER